MADTDTPAETETERQVRPFAAWLQDQRAGRCASELSDAMNELIEAVAEHGKAGSLVFTVKVKPASKGSGRTVLVADEVRVKKPEGDRPESIFFIDDDHNLTRSDPNQPQLPLREVPRPTEVTA